MSDYPQFLICTNKKTALGRVFVFHTKKPKFLGEILTFNSFSNFEAYRNKPGKDFLCKINDNIHIFCTYTEVRGKIVAMFVTDFFDPPQDPSGEVKIDGLMNRTSDWIKAYFND